MLTPPGSHTKEEGSQGTRGTRRRPGCLHEHAAGVSASLLRDPAMVGRPGSRLPHARVQAEVADELLRALEPLDVADGSLEGERHNHVDARDGHQPLDTLN